MSSTEKFILFLVVTFAALVVGAVTCEDIEHPCERYETKHHVFTIVAWDHKMRPMYGYGDEEVCVEREP